MARVHGLVLISLLVISSLVMLAESRVARKDLGIGLGVGLGIGIGGGSGSGAGAGAGAGS